MYRMVVPLLLLTLGACTQSQEDVAQQISAYGFTDIKTNGYDFFTCDNHDTFSTKFSAINTQGRKVEGVLCSGWFKGGTVRNLKVVN